MCNWNDKKLKKVEDMNARKLGALREAYPEIKSIRVEFDQVNQRPCAVAIIPVEFNGIDTSFLPPKIGDLPLKVKFGIR